MVKITKKEKAKIVRHYRKVIKRLITKESVGNRLERLFQNESEYNIDVGFNYGAVVSSVNLLILLEKMRKS